MALIEFEAPVKINPMRENVRLAIDATFNSDGSYKNDKVADEYIVATTDAGKTIAQYQAAAVDNGYTARKVVNEVVKDKDGKDTSKTRLVFRIVPKQRVGETRTRKDAPTAE